MSEPFDYVIEGGVEVIRLDEFDEIDAASRGTEFVSTVPNQ